MYDDIQAWIRHHMRHICAETHKQTHSGKRGNALQSKKITFSANYAKKQVLII